MKLLSWVHLSLAVSLASVTWYYVAPTFGENGTSVISVAKANAATVPMTVKLPPFMTFSQRHLLDAAYEIARADGYKEPRYLQGIILQESSAGQAPRYRVGGLTNGPNDRYFGVGQVKLVAAKTVMRRYPEMWRYLSTKTDEELQARLILDDIFNVRVTSKYALLQGINENPLQALAAYQLGPGGAATVDPTEHPYGLRVKELADKMPRKKRS